MKKVVCIVLLSNKTMSSTQMKLQGNDSFQRMNYLFQVSKFLADKDEKISAYYGNLIVNIAKKSVLKIHPDIKREICKRCQVTLVNNVTSSQKIKKIKNVKFLIISCKVCKAKKKIPIDRKKTKPIWVERPEAVVETICYD